MQNYQYQNINTGSRVFTWMSVCVVVTVDTNMSEEHAASISVVNVTLRMRGPFFSETFVPTYKTAQCESQEMDMLLQGHLRRDWDLQLVQAFVWLGQRLSWVFFFFVISFTPPPPPGKCHVSTKLKQDVNYHLLISRLLLYVDQMLKPWHISIMKGHVQGMYHIKRNFIIHIFTWSSDDRGVLEWWMDLLDTFTARVYTLKFTVCVT
jgi:hypothetical protein